MTSYKELHDSIIAGDTDKVKDLAKNLLESGHDALEIVSQGLIGGMSVVGQKMKSGDMFIPEVLASAHAMSEGMELLKPAIKAESLSKIYAGKVVIGTVQGDVHDIGKKIVSMILRSGGLVVIDLGVDVSADKFVDTVRLEKPNILGLSALLTTTMPRMGEVIEALKRSGLRDTVRVMLGGAPITQTFTDSIGADGYGPDAVSALELAKQFLG